MQRGSVLVLFLSFLPLMACSSERGATPSANAFARGCIEPGLVVDSSFAVIRAKEALGDSVFGRDFLALFKLERVEKGMVISLVPREPSTIDGGGLVWVDRDNGCAVVLRPQG